MAKRFTDTDKWKDEWFLELEPLMKILWIYILDTCDHAGIWRANFKLASYSIGTAMDIQSATKALDGKFKDLGRGLWFFPNFISYQYKGKLNPDNKAHLGVINALKLNGVDPSPFLAPVKALVSQDNFDPRCTGIGIGTGVGVGVGIGLDNSSSFNQAPASKFDPRKFLDAKKILPEEAPQDFRNSKGEEVYPKFTPDHVVDLWNKQMGSKYGHAVGLGSGKHLTNCLEAIKHLPTEEAWANLFTKCEESKHLRGENDIGWTVTLTWIVNFDNALRVLSDEFNDTKHIKNIFASMNTEATA